MNKQSWFAILGCCTLAIGLPVPAGAQVPPGSTQRMVSAPVLAVPGEHALLCATNSGTGGILPPESISFNYEEIGISYTPQTGGQETILGEAVITLPPLGSTPYPPSPCLEVVVPPSSTAAAAPSQVVIGVISVNPQPLPPGASFRGNPLLLCNVTALMQVFTPGPTGEPTNVRIAPLHPPQPC